jgi:hypothetical protein
MHVLPYPRPIASCHSPARVTFLRRHSENALASSQCGSHSLSREVNETLIPLQPSSLRRAKALMGSQQFRHGSGERSHEKECQAYATPQASLACGMVIRHH